MANQPQFDPNASYEPADNKLAGSTVSARKISAPLTEKEAAGGAYVNSQAAGKFNPRTQTVAKLAVQPGSRYAGLSLIGDAAIAQAKDRFGPHMSDGNKPPQFDPKTGRLLNGEVMDQPIGGPVGISELAGEIAPITAAARAEAPGLINRAVSGIKNYLKPEVTHYEAPPVMSKYTAPSPAQRITIQPSRVSEIADATGKPTFVPGRVIPGEETEFVNHIPGAEEELAPGISFNIHGPSPIAQDASNAVQKAKTFGDRAMSVYKSPIARTAGAAQLIPTVREVEGHVLNTAGTAAKGAISKVVNTVDPDKPASFDPDASYESPDQQ